jgi:hypothetical protein
MLDNILYEVDSNDMIRKPPMCTLNFFDNIRYVATCKRIDRKSLTFSRKFLELGELECRYKIFPLRLSFRVLRLFVKESG